jgi:PAS domain S-box-containing protein
MAEIAGEARGLATVAALAELARALAAADDEEMALATVAEHLPRVGVDAGALAEIAAEAEQLRDALLAGQLDGPSPPGDARQLVTTLLAGQLRALRMLIEQEAMAEERAVLHAVTHRLNAATTMEAALQVFRMPAPATDEASLTLGMIEDDAEGRPAWMTVIASLPAVNRPAVKVGTRYELAAIPASKWLLSEPGTPILIGSLVDEPRVDAVTREVYTRVGMGAALLMSLTVRGRIAGTLSLSWSRPIALGERERRIYQALARHAALLVDNNTMIERLQATLAATQEQEQLLGTVLDHVPVGIVCLEAESRRSLMVNRTAQTLLGGQGEDHDGSHLPVQILFPGTDTPVDEKERPAYRAAATGEVTRGEYDMVPPGGARVSTEVIGVPMPGADGKPARVVLVLTDVTARKLEAEARARLQEEVIRAQASALAERSSPLIPITDEVLVMPLIGTIDAERGDQILEAVLTGTRMRGARVTIIDVTGVPSIDTRAAAVLTGAARALRLLGVEAVLSGIGPDVAQALVALDVPLAGISTCGTLQAGIQYALQRLRRRL